MCKCGNENRPGQQTCKTCHAAYMREYRNTHPLTAEQRKKMNARSYVHVYLKRGKIKKQPCILCKDPDSQPHQTDYNKPLEVKWLCDFHHRIEHKKSRSYRL